MAKKKRTDSEGKGKAPTETMNRQLWTIIIGIAAFFTLMYSSKMIFPSRASKLDMGPIIENDDIFIVSSWVWDKRSKTMEIIYAIDGVYSIADNISSRIGITTNSGEIRHDGNLVYASEDTVVMRYNAIESNGTEFEVRLTVGNSSPHFFNNKNDISMIDELTDRSGSEYRILSLTTILNYYQCEIDNRNEEIKQNEEIIAQKEGDIESLKQNTANKTQSQIVSIENDIKNLNNEINNIQQSINQLFTEIEEFEERAENLRKEIGEINGNND